MAQNNFSLSKERIEVLHLFRNKDVTVFVEGDDDVVYWDTFFKMININAYIEPTHGKEKLMELSKRVIAENLKIILCKDRDYSFIIGCNLTNPNIVYTEGYSIENHLFCEKKISALIKKYSRSTINYTTELKQHYSRFERIIFDLLVYDIANEKYSKSIKVLGDNCNRFLKKNSSIELSIDKIENYINSIKEHFCDEELESIKFSINEEHVFQIIRGHFLTNFIINLVKHFIKIEKNLKKRSKNIKTNNTKVPSINPDNIFVETVDTCNLCRSKCQNCNSITSNLQQAINFIS